MNSTFPGCELTKDPFRWDQRIFSLVLRFKGNVDNDFVENVPFDSQINAMCEVTGGRSYAVATKKSLFQALESINTKILNGVVLHFEHLEGERNLASECNWRITKRMIMVNKSNPNQLAHWPIPECFWPSRDSRPIRTALPIIHFSSESRRVNVIENLPFDKYELEPSPLTQYILELRQPNVCWQTFVKSSGRDKQLKPFGYLKASIKGNAVNLFVMPYNYPVLFPLLESLIREHKLHPNNHWIDEFKTYLANIPLYYHAPLKVALKRMGLPGPLLSLVPEGADLFHNYLKQLKLSAKTRATEYLDAIRPKTVSTLDLPRPHVTAADILSERNQNKCSINSKTVCEETGLYRNPYDIPVSQLRAQLSQIRRELGVSTLRAPTNTTTGDRLADARARLNLPNSKMGDYQEVLARALRPVDVFQRNTMFGNPYKLGNSGSKKPMMMMMVADEAQVDDISQNKLTNRRRQLPLKPYLAPSPPVNHQGGCTTTPPPSSPQLTPPNTPPSQVDHMEMQHTPPQPPVSTPPLVFDKRPAPPPVPVAPPPPQPDGMPLKLRQPSPKTTNPTPFFSPTDTDIAAAIGSGNSNGVDKSSPATTTTTPTTGHVVKKQKTSVNPTINPSLKESFMKFSGKDSFIDKKGIVDTFSGVPIGTGETNGTNKDNGRTDEAKTVKKKSSSVGGADAKRENKRLRNNITKELRKPGQNYDQLFSLLGQLKGSGEMKRTFVDDIITDAQKFKKRALIERLKTWQKEIRDR
eukprot:sb/3462370/